jgi:hypothetical protein
MVRWLQSLLMAHRDRIQSLHDSHGMGIKRHRHLEGQALHGLAGEDSAVGEHGYVKGLSWL